MDNNNDDHGYPHAPGFRRDAPDTSAAAARSMTKIASTQRASVFAHITAVRAAGAIADDIDKAMGWDRNTCRPRISELSRMGLVLPSGNKRRGRSGREQTAWVIPMYAPGQAEQQDLALAL